MYLPYVARLSGDGATLIDFFTAPAGVIGGNLAITSSGGFAAAIVPFTAVGSALWIETVAPGPSLLAVVNSASQLYSSAIAPSELITLYGVGIGPQTPVNGQVQNGAFTSSLAGTRVLVDGLPGPLLYADSGQVDAVVPQAIGSSPHIQVVTPAGTIDGPTMSRADYVPAVFQNGGTGLAAAINQDGTVNSGSSPAAPGSIVTIFATGLGGNGLPDGALTPVEVPGNTLEVSVVSSTLTLLYEVEFAGNAPGLVSGVTQINFRVPDSPPLGSTLVFRLAAGGAGGVSSPYSQIVISH